MSVIRVNNITNRSGSAGPTIAGVGIVSSTSYMVVPTGRTGQRYADEGENIVRDGLVLYLDAKYSYPTKTGISTTTSSDGDPFNWYDMSGNGNDATITRTNVSTIPPVTFDLTNGGSIGFGTASAAGLSRGNGYFQLTPFNPGNPVYSVSCWFTTTGGNWNGALFGFGTGSSPDTQDVYLFGESASGCTSPTGGSFGFNTWNCDSWGFGNASAILKNTGYHHVVATFNHKDVRKNRLWLDGSEKTLTQQVGTTEFTANLNPQFGIAINGWNSGDQLWNGKIAHVAVYNKALTDAEVSQNFEALRSRFGI